MMKYVVIIERGENNLNAYVPDLPGCVATGDNEEDLRHLMKEAIELHLRGMREDGDAIPQPSAFAAYVND